MKPKTILNAPIVTAPFDTKEANNAPFSEKWRLLQNMSDSVLLMVRHNVMGIEYRPMFFYSFNYKLRSNKKLSRIQKFDLMNPNPDNIDNVADKLRYYRHQHKLSQIDLARLLGIDRAIYGRYEDCKHEYYPIDRMQRIADFYDMQITDLLDEYNLFIYQGQAEQFKKLRKSLCLSLADVAERLDVNLAAVKRWSQEVTRLPKRAFQQLQDMKKAVNR